jgi:hypothetical protein
MVSEARDRYAPDRFGTKSRFVIRDRADFGEAKRGKDRENAGCHFSSRKSDRKRGGIEPDEEACELQMCAILVSGRLVDSKPRPIATRPTQVSILVVRVCN